MKQIEQFDYVVVNHSNQIECAVNEIKAIITAEKMPRQNKEKLNYEDYTFFNR